MRTPSAVFDMLIKCSVLCSVERLTGFLSSIFAEKVERRQKRFSVTELFGSSVFQTNTTAEETNQYHSNGSGYPLCSVTFLFDFLFDIFFKVPGTIGSAKSGITAVQTVMACSIEVL